MLSRLLLPLLLAAAPLSAAEEEMPLRVIGVEPLTVDRGARDGLAPGDRIELRARDGRTFPGRVLEVDGRNAVVAIDDPSFAPEPGTPGVAYLPAERRGEAEGPGEETPAPGGAGEAPATAPDGFTTEMPLLAGRPLRPEQRPRRISGRAYAIGGLTGGPGDLEEQYLRLGVDFVLENPFAAGGRIRASVELAHLTDRDEVEGSDFLLRRLSYAWGGTRFSPSRFEVGRFLPLVLPEFGVLDGIEWSVRREEGHRFGIAAGWLPLPDDDFDSGDDAQLSGFYEWVSDPSERLVVTAGFQFTFHDFDADRDLLVAKVRYLPGGDWDIHASVWIDFYTAKDDAKDSFAEVTQALLTLTRRFADGGGLDLAFRHLSIPQTLRAEFPPLPDAELADDRYDRISADAWRPVTEHLRLHGHLSGYDDEDGPGFAAEAGAGLFDFGPAGLHADATFFASIGRFERNIGGRLTLGRSAGGRSYECAYEFSSKRFTDVPDDQDDLVQHRFRAAGSLELGRRFDLSLQGEAALWDGELSWSFHVALHKRF